MGAAKDNPWSDERVERLTRMWTIDGLSAGQIAKQLGGITRNSVIGKVHRMGLACVGRVHATKPRAIIPKSAPRQKMPPLPKAGEPGVIVVRAINSKRVVENLLRIEPVITLPAGSMARPWETRKEGECAWPVNTWAPGEGRSAMSCCAPVSEGSPYCREHKIQRVNAVQPARPPSPLSSNQRRAA